jgi:hypothetical protein
LKLDKNVGGVVGYMTNNAVISGITVTNTYVNADNLVGGIVGKCDSGSIVNSIINGCSITARDENPEIGILFGRKGDGTSSGCRVTGQTFVNSTVNSTAYVNQNVQ